MHGATPGRSNQSHSRGADATGQAALAEVVMTQVAHGDEAAFTHLYDQLADQVFGLVRRVMRDPAQSEEVTQEVFLELWRTAPRYRAEKGGVQSWALTIAHRRAVDRVRSLQASTAREAWVAAGEHERPFDAVANEVAGNIERRQVRRCLAVLTQLQRESISLAYYQGFTYREVSSLLETPLGTIKTRLRDGLIRLRDCLGVAR